VTDENLEVAVSVPTVTSAPTDDGNALSSSTQQVIMMTMLQFELALDSGTLVTGIGLTSDKNTTFTFCLTWP